MHTITIPKAHAAAQPRLLSHTHNINAARYRRDSHTESETGAMRLELSPCNTESETGYRHGQG